MIVFAPFVLAQAIIPYPPVPAGKYVGFCDYPPQAEEFADRVVFVECEGLIVSDEDRRVKLVFGGPELSDDLTFSGTRTEESIIVTHVQVGSAELITAHGTCNSGYRHGIRSVVTCFAHGDRLTYAGRIELR